jgi:hypothetical protein
MNRNPNIHKTAPMPSTTARTQPMPQIPTRERMAMRTQLMATQRMELMTTRASELPGQMAAALARVAEAAARFATNEARACVRTLLVALDVGALEQAKRYVEGYVERVGFIGEPTADVQAALRGELAVAYRRMPPDQRRHFDVLFAELHRSHPKAWITQPFAR